MVLYSINEAATFFMWRLSVDFSQAMEAPTGDSWSFNIKSRKGKIEKSVCTSIGYFPVASYEISLRDLTLWEDNIAVSRQLNTVWGDIPFEIRACLHQREMVGICEAIMSRLIASWSDSGYGEFPVTVSRPPNRLLVVIGGAPSRIRYVRARDHVGG